MYWKAGNARESLCRKGRVFATYPAVQAPIVMLTAQIVARRKENELTEGPLVEGTPMKGGQ
jgi:hypothetical protein